ncbi:cell division protein FtsQ/DivIB [Streptomyces xantholiticus]|uniref:cell division protein FtsQ/DivIB n=1 Tax=Streptomyces xantholiticus TaxID=68285 RepID=UPI00167A9970|nr:FtsQ-type POTRA domain-containing protein [Streptomyces xantholiticus]GGW32178.1 cell division protein FtsQ [Streptomyces xantholiticus]
MAGPTTAKRSTPGPSGGPDGPNGADGKGRPSRVDTPPGRFRRPGPRFLLIALAALLLVAGVLWLLYGSSWLRAEHVETTGTDVLTPAEVEAAAKVPIGEPLVSVDTDAVEARLVRALPRIDSVEVGRAWPHGIELVVIERKPVLLLEKGEKFVEVDADGVRFATVVKAPKDVPLLRLEVDRSPSLKRFGPDRLLAEAVRVQGDLPPKVTADLKSMKVVSYDYISLKLSGNRTVVWGSSEAGEAKARALEALMKAAPKAGYFDVSAPSAPATSGS